MSQHDFNIDDAPGAGVRADLNNALQALATLNSGASEPTTTYANMWWFDTSTNILKQRNAGNTAWVNVAYKDGSGWTPYLQGTKLDAVLDSLETALESYADSAADDAEAAAKAASFSKTEAGEIAALDEKTSLVDNDVVVIEDSEDGSKKKKSKRSNLIPPDDLKLLSVTTVTGATNTGDIAIAVNKQYLVMLTIRNDSGDDTNVRPGIRVNSDSNTKYQYVKRELTLANPPAESDVGTTAGVQFPLSDMGGETEGGALHASFILDTHSLNRSVNSGSLFIKGDGISALSANASTKFSLWGVYYNKVDPASFEILTSQNCDIVVRLFEFAQS